MTLTTAGSCIAAILFVAAVEVTQALPRPQAATPPPAPVAPAPPSATPPSSTTPSTPSPSTLIGCVSGKPGGAGQYTFQETDGLRQYRLNGKDIKKFAGQRVEIVPGQVGKGLSIRGGLWPSPNVAARGGDVDPAQEAISRQPGGGGAPAVTEVPELRVTRLRAIDGGCL